MTTTMRIGGGLFLFAIGAILYWAVNYQIPGVSLHMIGLILMIVGGVGLLVGLIGGATRSERLT